MLTAGTPRTHLTPGLASEAEYSDGEWQVKGHLCPAFLPWDPLTDSCTKHSCLCRGERESGTPEVPLANGKCLCRLWLV